MALLDFQKLKTQFSSSANSSPGGTRVHAKKFDVTVNFWQYLAVSMFFPDWKKLSVGPTEQIVSRSIWLFFQDYYKLTSAYHNFILPYYFAVNTLFLPTRNFSIKQNTFCHPPGVLSNSHLFASDVCNTVTADYGKRNTTLQQKMERSHKIVLT